MCERIVWFYVKWLQCNDPWYMGGKCDNKKAYLTWEHLLPEVVGYKRGSDITEEVKSLHGTNGKRRRRRTNLIWLLESTTSRKSVTWGPCVQGFPLGTSTHACLIIVSSLIPTMNTPCIYSFMGLKCLSFLVGFLVSSFDL